MIFCSRGLQQQYSRTSWHYVFKFRLDRATLYCNSLVSGMMGGAGVSISSDFLPMGSSTRSRMLELNVEYRDRCRNLFFEL